MKIIIWGHKLHSHTHSYVHGAFYKAFKSLGYETYWLDNNDVTKDMSFNDCIFLTEGQVDQHIPINSTNKYILHNCNTERYPLNTYLNLQVYSNGVENSLGVKGTKLSECVYFDANTKTLYQPWATDLLPEEFTNVFCDQSNKTAVWVGSISSGYHGNIEELNSFNEGLAKHNYTFKHLGCSIVDFETNKEYVQTNELAPSIVGRWQKINGYVPCRIFKNISYGQLGLTNSETVFSLLQNSCIYANNCVELIDKYLTLSKEQKVNLFTDANQLVREEHTYLNRIKTILTYL